MLFNLKTVIAILLIYVTSFNLYANKTIPKKDGVVITYAEFNHLSKRKWNASFDIQALKEYNLLDFLDNYNLSIVKNAQLNFNNIPNEIDHLDMYGNTVINQGMINLILHGNFKEASIENLVFNQLLNNEQNQQFEKLKSYHRDRVEIFTYKVLGEKKNKKIYATKVNEGLIIVSNTKITSIDKKLTTLFDKKHTKLSDFKKKEGELVTFQIDTEAVRKKLQKDSFFLQSKVFNNTKNIVFKVVKIGSTIFFASALDTKNNETAIKINTVITGIIENNINNKQKLTNINKTLINNLKTSIDDTRVILKTSMPLINDTL